MFKKKLKKSKILADEIVVSEELESITETKEEIIIESDEVNEEIILKVDDDIIIESIDSDELSDNTVVFEEDDIELIDIDTNGGRKSYIEEEDLKYKEVIDDIEVNEEPTTNFINLDIVDNEIIDNNNETLDIPGDISNLSEEEKELVDSIDEDKDVTESELIPNKNAHQEENDKDLKKYFKDSKKINKELSVKKKKKKRTKKTSKRSLKQKKIYDDIQNQRVYRFRGKKYSKVQDFISYLNDNYLDIEKISKEVLDDKNFYGFIAKKSGVFDTSIKEFKKIKEEIDN